ncbi:hypothetical protein NQ314_011906 [Rhamnusium bicolor]|uniref:Uncharacterized protein n=1 Tax=Rhamnusium bicolor TaxID=1586634 RepID=A0AAV8XF27_9CUCU|nr:hypothetical protein NQ314_011906 [Rhamnusium bicolor]
MQRRTIEEKQALNDGCYDGVCWEDDDYPAAKIMEKLLLSDRSNLDTFGKHDDNVIIEVPEKSCDLCERTLSLKITPLTITRSNKKYFVVNTGNYQQKITYNICKP